MRPRTDSQSMGVLSGTEGVGQATAEGIDVITEPQELHSVSPAPLNCVDEHGVQAVAPVLPWYIPAGHAVQADAPPYAANDPALHSTHTVDRPEG
jgi:hypothetical protein